MAVAKVHTFTTHTTYRAGHVRPHHVFIACSCSFSRGLSAITASALSSGTVAIQAAHNANPKGK